MCAQIRPFRARCAAGRSLDVQRAERGAGRCGGGKPITGGIENLSHGGGVSVRFRPETVMHGRLDFQD